MNATENQNESSNSAFISRHYLVILYLLANVLANVLLGYFGPIASIPIAILFIGFDFTSRDKLHDQWKNRGVFWKMSILIISGGLISWTINQSVYPIAVGSALAFILSGATDFIVYSLLVNKSFIVRSNVSNVASSLVDSISFPLLVNAFAPVVFFPPNVLYTIIILQSTSKIFGGFIWSIILRRKNASA